MIRRQPAPAPPSFSGHLLVRNVSSASVSVTASLQADGEKKALPEFTLASGQAKKLAIPDGSIPSSVNGKGIGVQVRHTGEPGSVIASWLSVDESGSLAAELPMRSPSPHERGGGGHPWSLEGGNSSVLFVHNTGEQPAKFFAVIHFPGGDYYLGRHEIPAGDTYRLDIPAPSAGAGALARRSSAGCRFSAAAKPSPPASAARCVFALRSRPLFS